MLVSSIPRATAAMYFLISYQVEICGGAVASWLVRSTPERAVRVRALAGYIVLCSWATHVTSSHVASLHMGV